MKDEHDALLRTAVQFQSELGSIYCERERALGECDEACQGCIIARQERDTATVQMKEATRAASRLAEENRQLKPEV